MGGGDLNLKKSWHPQTLRNVEKVWKAEQKAEAESKKIDQLRKELEEERAREEMQRHAVEQGIAKKKGERLDWMYAAAAAGGQVDHEMYLLGKPVDKAVDPMAQENEEDLSAPGASFMNDTGANTANDLAAKVRDDPLFLIKRKEEEKRKELLNNPVKMKQLKMMLRANLDKSSKKKKDKKKKREKGEKKRRKERHARESDSESEDNEREIGKESKRKRKEKYNRSDDSEGDEGGMAKEHDRRREERNRRRSDGSDDEREMAKYHKSRRKEERMEMWNGNRRKHHRESKRGKEEEDDRRLHRRNGEHYSNRHRSPDRKRPQVRSRSRSPINRRDRERRNEQRHRRNSSGSPSTNRRHRSRSPSHSPPRKSRKSPSPDRRKSWQKGGPAVTKQIDAVEKEKRLAAMMENAKWRDEQRGKNVKRYKEEDAKLAAEEALSTDKSATFLNDVKIQSFSSKTTSSVSDRIRRNINSVQRTTAALESFLGK